MCDNLWHNGCAGKNLKPYKLLSKSNRLHLFCETCGSGIGLETFNKVRQFKLHHAMGTNLPNVKQRLRAQHLSPRYLTKSWLPPFFRDDFKTD